MAVWRSAGVALALGLVTAACAHGASRTAQAAPVRDTGFISQEPGGGLFSLGRPRSGGGGGASGGQAIGVNAYLWRATLDTLAFMPLSSADPYGGVVITDWYTNPEKPDERFKATVYILDTRLRADGLNVTVFKQVKGADGQWADSSVAGQTDVDIENAILTRARQLRLSNLSPRG